ncbi:uncharacterized protein PHACADRAFT_63720, partial [Phanerochaete carnosa HHB-10118-sp]
SYQFPDLPSCFAQSFRLRTNRHCRAASEAARRWTAEQGFFGEREREALEGTKLGLLAALCFSTCDLPQLTRAAEFFTLLFHWWDHGLGERSQATWQGLWTQLCRTTSKSWQARFQAYLIDFEDAGLDSEKSEQTLTSIEVYMSRSRRSSGFLMALAFIEYAEGLDLPEEVFGSQALTKLRLATLDLVIWMHDIASYNVQQASNHAHNAIAVLVTSQHVSLQAAIHRAGDRVKALVAEFLAHEAALAQCSWGPYADRDVRVYIAGLRDCVVGTAHWIYRCDRYFLGKGEDIKAFGWVFLLPKETEDEGEG